MHALDNALRNEQRWWHLGAGLRIVSALSLDELLPPTTPGAPDLSIELVDRPFPFAGTHVLSVGEPGAPWLEVRRLTDGYAVLWGEDLHAFIPDGGARMQVFDAGTIQDSVTRLLLCHAMSFVLPWHGREAIHASAVEIDGRAVVIAGGSGRGKSTLATALCARGARLLADDLTSLRLTDAGVVVDPTSNRTWLWREVAAEMALERTGDSSRPRKVTVRSDAAPEPVPVAAMFVLGFKADAAMLGQPLAGTNAVRTFLAQLFNYAIRTSARLSQQFHIATELCGTVPVVPALWEPGPARADAMAEQIERFVREPSNQRRAQMHIEDANTQPATDRRKLLDLLAAAGVDADLDEQFDEPLLRTAQVAALLRTSDRTIRTWAEAGKLTYIKTLGGRRLFPASGVMRVMKTMRGATARGEA